MGIITMRATFNASVCTVSNRIFVLFYILGIVFRFGFNLFLA